MGLSWWLLSPWHMDTYRLPKKQNNVGIRWANLQDLSRDGSEGGGDCIHLPAQWVPLPQSPSTAGAPSSARDTWQGYSGTGKQRPTQPITTTTVPCWSRGVGGASEPLLLPPAGGYREWLHMVLDRLCQEQWWQKVDLHIPAPAPCPVPPPPHQFPLPAVGSSQASPPSSPQSDLWCQSYLL